MHALPDTAIGWGWNPAFASSAPEWVKCVDFIEVIPESLARTGGKLAGPDLILLEQIADIMPLAFHGVGLGLGGTTPFLDQEAADLAFLTQEFAPALVSQHCSFVRAGSEQSFELLPVPHTQQRIRIMCDQVDRLQAILQRPILLENVTRYVDYRCDEMNDCSFLAEVSRRTGALLLFDVNNHIINCANRGEDPIAGLTAIDPSRVAQFHVAGHSRLGDFLFDSHTLPIADATWELLATVLRDWGPRPIVLECDDPLVSWPTQRETLRALRQFVRNTLAQNSGQLLSAEPGEKGTAPPSQTDGFPSPKPVTTSVISAPRHNRAKAKNLDQDFVTALRNPQSAAAQRTKARLKPQSAYRLHAYQLSHFSRVTIDLLETVLLPLKGLAPQDSLLEWLAAFFQQHPPRHPHLFENLSALVDFARTAPPLRSDTENSRNRTGDDWSAAAALCLDRWHVLHSARSAAEPKPHPTQAGSSEQAQTWQLAWPARASSPLSRRLVDRLLRTRGNSGQALFGEVKQPEGVTANRAAAEVLFLLNNPVQGLQTFRLPAQMQPLVEALCDGESIEESCTRFAASLVQSDPKPPESGHRSPQTESAIHVDWPVLVKHLFTEIGKGLAQS